MPRFGVVGLLILLLMLQPVSNVELTNLDEVQQVAKNSGVDLSATDVSIRYSNPSDESQYKMFSSNHPIVGLERSKNLYVTDTVNSTPMDIEVTIRNDGSTPSGIITIQMLILHNEYERFVLANRTVTMNSLGSNGQATAIFYNVYVNYSGNHSMIVTPTFQGIDDNPNNDNLNRHYTVANFYFTCTSLVGWNAGLYWSTSTDTALSMGQSCHIGQGQFSSYTNNLQTDLMTPIWDMSDIVQSPTRTNGLSFFYSGSVEPNDSMKVMALDNQGNWDELANIAGTVGTSLSNWNTISNNNMGHTSPLIPADVSSHFHSNSRFKFSFTSDTSGTDIGYWIDDIVIIYDQSARSEEYNLDVSGVFTDGAIPGGWGTIRMELRNIGNISDSILPSVNNLPNDWNVAFSFPSGAGINPNTGVRLLPGESRVIDIKLQPSVNASIGFVPLTFTASSLQNPAFSVQEGMQFQVSADRIPFIHIPEVKPKCAPGSSCAFYLDVENIGQATDVFDLGTESKSLENGWSVNLAFDQSPSIRLIPNQVQSVKFVMTVPQGEMPDKTGEYWFTMTAQNDTSRSITQAIVVQASMISDALIELDIDENEVTMMSAGERVEIRYTVTNQATRQDSFELDVDYIEAIGWTIEEEQRPLIVINPGSSTSFYIAIIAPVNAQANDIAPEIKPILTSTRSGTQYDGPAYNNIMIETLYDASISVLSSSSVLIPGGTTTIDAEIVNNGNGPTTVSVSLIDAPASWLYSIRLNGVILENPSIEMGVSYLGENRQQFEILLNVPMTEAAGEFHTVNIRVNTEGNDIKPDDNDASIDMITGSVRFPEYNGSVLDVNAMVGSTHRINGTLTNVGNALESSMDVMFELSTSPPTTDVMAFLTAGLGGPTSESGEVVTFPMSAGTSKLIFVDVIIGDDVPLNTRVVVTITVEGGENIEGEILTLEHQNLITVNQQRKVDIILSEIGNESFNNKATAWLNFTSMSTQTEPMSYSFIYPEEWQIMCDDILISSNEFTEISLPYERNSGSLKDVRCEVQRIGDKFSGEVTVEASTLDKEIEFTETILVLFDRPNSEKSSFASNLNGPTLVAGSLGLILLMVIVLVVRKQRHVVEEIEEENQVAGPPISSQITVESEFNTAERTVIESMTPPLPESGLPAGWSMEQWTHYGHQYLERMGKQP